MNIDKTSYNKAKLIPYTSKESCGYNPRKSTKPSSILVHTTNGNAGTTFDQEAKYIYRSRTISSHFLIGKKGEIVQFLNPALYIAWHAGCVNNYLWSNDYSIGIEMHNTVTEGKITEMMFLSLDWLVRQLLTEYDISSMNIATHRSVAVFCKGHPLAGRLGRKIDPSGFSDEEFNLWKRSLATSPIKTYQVINRAGVYIRQSPQVNDHNIAGTLNYLDIFTSDSLKDDEKNEIHNGSNKWAHILKGTSNGKPVDQLGFVSLGNLKQI